MNLHRRKSFLTAALLLILCVMALAFSPQCKEGAAKGIDLCLRVLTPSLFPVMAISGLAVQTGVCRQFGKFFEKPTRLLFGLNGSCASSVLLSLIGGYPVGAKAIADLYRSGQVTLKQAQRAALFCVGAGPAFLVSFVGSTLYNSEQIGTILLCSQILSVLLSGIVLRIFGGKIGSPSQTQPSATSLPFSAALVKAVHDASIGMLSISGLVILFSALGNIGEDILPTCAAEDILLSLLDVSTGVCRLQGTYPLPLLAFLVGFGGLCVHFQIFAALGELAVHKPLFFFFRIFQGGLTALFTHLGMTLYGKEIAVFSTSVTTQSGFYGGSVLSGAALLTVAIVFLFTLKNH